MFIRFNNLNYFLEKWDIVEHLIEKGADVNVENDIGWTIIDFTARGSEIEELIRRKGGKRTTRIHRLV